MTNGKSRNNRLRDRRLLLAVLGMAIHALTVFVPCADASGGSRLLFLGNRNIPPVVYLDHDAPSGVAVDIVRALAQHMPRPVEIRAVDWPEAQKSVAEGKADALIQINQTEERQKIYDFSDTLLESQFSIFTATDRVDISGVASLRGRRVGVEAGGLPSQVLGKDPLIHLTIIRNFLEGFKLLNDGAVDAVVVDYRVGSYVIAENRLRNIKVAGKPIATSYSAIAVKKGNAELLAAIDNALRIIKADGTYQKILHKWKPKEVVFLTREQIRLRTLYLASFILFASLLVAVIGTVTTRKELTRRRAAEENLRRLNERLALAAEAAGLGVWDWDIRKNKLVWDERMYELYGVSKQDFGDAYEAWLQGVHPGDRARCDEISEQARRGEREYDTEFRIVWPDGRIRHLKAHGRVVRDASGAPLRMTGINFDITESKRTEKMAEARLRMLETAYLPGITLDDTLRLMLDEIESQAGSRIGFYHFLEEDQQTLSLQNWSTNTLAGMCTTEGKGRHYPVKEAGVWADCVRERRPVIHNDYASLPDRKGMPEGHAEVVRELVVPVFRGPRIVAIVGVGNKPREYDETDVQIVSLLGDFSWEIVVRKRSEEALRRLNEELDHRVKERTAELEEANARLQELDRMKTMFIASMSHELRTPLNSAIGFTRILQSEWVGTLNEEQQENLAKVLKSCRHLLALINDVIDVSRIEAGMITAEPEEFDVWDLVSDAAASYETAVREKGIGLEVRAIHHTMRTDRTRLLQCLLNLVTNAVKYTEKGTITISAELADNGTRLELSVGDSGIGIEEENIGKLFSPFVRLASPLTATVPGTGLGLYLTGKLTREVLRGAIAVKSALGKGSEFVLSVPVSL